MQKSNYFSDKMLIFLAMCVIASFLCQILKVPFLVNVIYIISLVLVLFCYVVGGHYNGITFFITIFIAVAAVINGFRVRELDYYTHLLITLCIFMCIDVSSLLKISVKTFKTISDMFFVTTIILLVLYYLGPLKNTYFGLQNAICLNFNNPNAAGLWLTCFFILLLYSCFLYKSTKRTMYFVAAIALLPIILATQSRNSFFACIFFVVALLIKKIFTIKKIPNWILVTISILPIIVFLFYMYVVVDNIEFWEGLLSVNGMDKGVGSRQSVWQGVIDNFSECFLFGNYYKYYDSQQHNSMLTIFCRFGLPVTILACVSIYRALKNVQQNSSYYATISLSAIFFTGCFEASVFVGIAGMYLMLLIIPACASVEKVVEDKKIN